jgi:hypothetical protein
LTSEKQKTKQKQKDTQTGQSGISDTTTGCNSKLVVSQDKSVVAVMPKGKL